MPPLLVLLVGLCHADIVDFMDHYGGCYESIYLLCLVSSAIQIFAQYKRLADNSEQTNPPNTHTLKLNYLPPSNWATRVQVRGYLFITIRFSISILVLLGI